ncbi:MAG: terpene cyclase/mutase family protein [Actinomycetia bacterium]|nr:terpene cyclase/mutase family protein [Actinomycetes bacterium]
MEPIDLPAAAAASTERARAHLLGLQDQAGWWRGLLRTNVTMDAEDLLLRKFLGILREEDLVPAARWIRSQQRPDGSWATFEGGPADLSTTIEAYVALRLAGDGADDAHLAQAREFILAAGGLEASRVFTRLWLALFGEWSWDELPAMPPELVLLPKWAPLNIYDWGCWARQTVVAITVVATLRPVRPLPFRITELRLGASARGPAPARGRGNTLDRAFHCLDRVLRAYHRAPVHPGRQTAFRRAAEWIIARQESDGGWGGIQPPWVYSIIALHLLGYPLDHPVMRAAIDGLEGFMVRQQTPDGPIRWLEACQSPVWDACLAVTALLDAGTAPDDPAVARATEWLLGEEIRVPGDWQVKRPGLAPGGWAFEFANDNYPDIDDTAEVVLALNRVAEHDAALAVETAAAKAANKRVGKARLAAAEAAGERAAAVRAAIARGVAWTVGMACADGGWGAFDADNTSGLIAKLPFCDFGAVTDPPSADVTAHVVEMLARLDLADSVACRRGVSWLLAAQEPDGAWFGRWGANYVYGTGAVVPALIAAGMAPDAPPIRRAVRWLERHQNEDGGWGEDLRSYTEHSWRGRGASTASQTAWALLALLAVDPAAPAARRGVGYLCASQRPDGSWDEDLYTGTGFPGDFYINYELYRLVFPLSALGRYVGAVGATAPPAAAKASASASASGGDSGGGAGRSRRRAAAPRAAKRDGS